MRQEDKKLICCDRLFALRLAAFLLLTLPVPSIGAPAQKAGDGSSSVTIRANVRQVLVPVVVTDKKGHYITDLKVSDFQVFEDGALQRIVAFSAAPDSMVLRADGTTVTHMGSVATPGVEQSGSTDPPRRTYLICVDTLHSSFANFARVREALRKFFEQEESGDSQYALIALGRELTVVKDSTRDPAEILSAVEDKRFLKAIRDSEASNTAMAMQEFYELMGRYCKTCGCPFPLQQQLPGCPGAKGQVQSALLRFGQRTLGLNQTFLRELNQVVAATGSMPTTRTIVFISDGFNRQPGNELYAIVEAADPGARDFGFNPQNTEDLLQNVIRLAVRNDVRFYTLDSRGLYVLASIDGSTWDVSTRGGGSETLDRNEMNVFRENTDGLAELANDTGGLFFENNNDLLKGVRRAFADGREHYVLAYVPSNKKLDGTYRKILVELKNRHFQVHAKPGYWATQE